MSIVLWIIKQLCLKSSIFWIIIKLQCTIIRLQIKMQIHDLNGRFKKSNMKIVSSFNALFPALLLHEKKKDIRFWAGRVCNNIFVLLRLFGIFIPLYSNRNSRVRNKLQLKYASLSLNYFIVFL